LVFDLYAGRLASVGFTNPRREKGCWIGRAKPIQQTRPDCLCNLRPSLSLRGGGKADAWNGPGSVKDRQENEGIFGDFIDDLDNS